MGMQLPPDIVEGIARGHFKEVTRKDKFTKEKRRVVIMTAAGRAARRAEVADRDRARRMGFDGPGDPSSVRAFLQK